MKTRTETKPRKRHPRPLKGADRRAQLRTERDELTIILHPALFQKNLEGRAA